MKRIATTISIAGLVAFACDVADREDRPSSRRAELVDEIGTSNAIEADDEESEDLVDEAERGALASGVDEQSGGGPAPTGANDIAAEIDPQYTEPSCGLGTTSFNAFACEWERLDDTSGTGAQASCNASHYVLSGGCYGVDGSHTLLRSYPTETTFDLIGTGTSEVSVATADGWACEWDTAATGSGDRHIVAALCCPSTGNIPTCV